MVLRKTKTSLITLITLLFAVNMNLSGANTGKILKTLEKEFDVDKSEIELVELTAGNEFAGKVEAVYMVKLNQEDTGYVIDAMGMGRYDKFEFVICTDLSKNVEFVRIVNYYSEHGGEIAAKKWLDQFTGYQGSDLKYGEDIQAISGATLSATSIVSRIHEIISLLKESDL